MSQRGNATNKYWVDTFLKNVKEYPKETTCQQKEIINRLEIHSLEMEPFYKEIDEKLPNHKCRNPGDITKRNILNVIVDCALDYEDKSMRRNNREKGIKVKDTSDKELEKTQKKIEKKTNQLINLLDQHTKRVEKMQKNIAEKTNHLIVLLNQHAEINEKSCLISEACKDPVGLLIKAAELMPFERLSGYGSCKTNAKVHLEELSTLYKYLPTLQEMLSVLANEMSLGLVFTNSVTEAVFNSRQTNYLNFIKGIQNYIEKQKEIGCLPEEFKLSYGSLGIIVKYVLGENMTAEHIRGALTLQQTRSKKKKA